MQTSTCPARVPKSIQFDFCSKAHFLVFPFVYAVSSTVGSQNAMLIQADASSMYLRLKYMHCTGAGWSPNVNSAISGATQYKLRVWTEAGLSEYALVVEVAHEGLLRCLMKALMSLMMLTLVDIRMVLPSLMNMRPVPSHSFS